MRPFAFVLLSILVTACTAPEPKAPPPGRVLGGVTIDGATLARGARGYRTVCASCHGMAGDGNGRLGVRQNPKPRSFTEGIVKFSSARAGELWRDEDVLWTLKNGLLGTQMLAVKLPDSELDAIVQHLKTFSPRWEQETAGEPVAIPAMPTSLPVPSAGAELYAARCVGCHESGRSVPTVWEEPAVSPDLRVRVTKASSSPRRLYRTLAAGIGGVEGHEALVDVLSEDELWALVAYVRANSPPAR